MNDATKSIYIKINGISDVTEFVKQASQVFGDVAVQKGRFVVDGKSVMGMFSLDLSNGATVFYPLDAKDFEDYVKKFKAE